MWQTELWSSYEQLRGRQFALTFKTIPQLLCFDCWHRQPWHLLIHLTHWVVSEARVTLDTSHDRRRSLSGCFYTLTAALNFLRYSRYLGTKMLQCCGILMVSNLPAPWCKSMCDFRLYQCVKSTCNSRTICSLYRRLASPCTTCEKSTAFLKYYPEIVTSFCAKTALIFNDSIHPSLSNSAPSMIGGVQA